jgi:hypothetical protein
VLTVYIDEHVFLEVSLGKKKEGKEHVVRLLHADEVTMAQSMCYVQTG